MPGGCAGGWGDPQSITLSPPPHLHQVRRAPSAGRMPHHGMWVPQAGQATGAAAVCWGAVQPAGGPVAVLSFVCVVSSSLRGGCACTRPQLGSPSSKVGMSVQPLQMPKATDGTGCSVAPGPRRGHEEPEGHSVGSECPRTCLSRTAPSLPVTGRPEGPALLTAVTVAEGAAGSAGIGRLCQGVRWGQDSGLFLRASPQPKNRAWHQQPGVPGDAPACP